MQTGTPDRSGQVQALARALSVLDHLAQAEGGLTLTEVAQRAGLAPSTAHRLLTTLEGVRYVRFDPEGRLWTVGVQAFIAGSGFLRTRDVVRMARPHMRALMEESGETANLAVPDQDTAVYLAQVECREMMRSLARLGARVPLHCSGVGKALLAAMAPGERARIVARAGLPAMTDRTVVDPSRLEADLGEIRARGYAIDDGEHAVGLRCVAAVVRDEHGDPACAVSISGPMARITDARMAQLGAMVRETADRVSAEIGGTRR
jgi:IclR family acetate operon transcriptional repressor